MGLAIPTITGESRISRSAFAPVISLSYLGMMTGGAIAGIVGDRLGRRNAFVGSMLVFSVMTTAMTAVDSMAALGCCVLRG
jgi:MFS family permease